MTLFLELGDFACHIFRSRQCGSENGHCGCEYSIQGELDSGGID
jgi:hypothetical protein